jgi:L-aminopeptidase/D-esterase-like protein
MLTDSNEWRPGPKNAITDVAGIRVGHWTDRRRATGCTVIRCETAVAAAVDTRGGAPGTRETDVLGLSNLVRTCHAIVLTGGSAFGLASATGVMRSLSEQGVGFETAHGHIPIVPAAVLYDLGVGDARAFPGEEAGYLAARGARGGRVAEGSVGAGTGATVAKLLGPDHQLKGGVGTASCLGPRGIVVGAIVVTNAAGSIYDPETGACIAGPRDGNGGFVPLPAALAERTVRVDRLLENTTLIVVGTNATLEPHHLHRVAIHAHDGLARVVQPAHTFADGDVAFAVSVGGIEARADDVLTVGALAAHAVEQALLRSVRMARGVRGAPAAAEYVA